MPKLEIEEIKQAISNGLVGAVTLDTNIFDRFDCNLNARALLSMSQFRGTQVEFILSQVVADEVRAHIAGQAESALASLKRAVRDARKYWRRDMDLEAARGAHGIAETPAEFMENQFKRYIEATKAHCVPLDGMVQPSDVFVRYFNATAPFAAGERKKSEFPDAFALLSLEAWAKQHATKLIAVSDDKDWQKFGEKSDFIIVLDSLETTLGAFNANASFIVSRTLQMLEDGAAPNLHNHIAQTLSAMLELLDPDVQGHSTADDWELDNLDINLEKFELSGDEADVLEVSDDEVTFAFTVTATVSFEADIIFSARDPIDGDYVPLGYKTFKQVQSLYLPLVVTIPSEIDEEPEALEVSATPVAVVIDYGDLNPYFYDDDD